MIILKYRHIQICRDVSDVFFNSSFSDEMEVQKGFKCQIYKLSMFHDNVSIMLYFRWPLQHRAMIIVTLVSCQNVLGAFQATLYAAHNPFHRFSAISKSPTKFSHGRFAHQQASRLRQYSTGINDPHCQVPTLLLYYSVLLCFLKSKYQLIDFLSFSDGPFFRCLSIPCKMRISLRSIDSYQPANNYQSQSKWANIA